MTSITSKISNAQLLQLHEWLGRRQANGTLSRELTYESLADEATATIFHHFVGVTARNVKTCCDRLGVKLQSAKQQSQRQSEREELKKLRADVDDLKTVTAHQGRTLDRLIRRLGLDADGEPQRDLAAAGVSEKVQS